MNAVGVCEGNGVRLGVGVVVLVRVGVKVVVEV
jgi:hypothetical protein